MKNIIILGEEYWFEKPDTIFTESKYLLSSLEKHRDKSKYNYVIIKTPAEIIRKINELEIKNIKAIFLFQDILSDSYLNKKTILEMINYMKDIQNQGIYIYPPIEVINNFGSKKYNLILNQKLQWAMLPHTKVYYFKNYDFKDENKIFTGLYKNVQDLWKTFTKVIVKKGYSYEGKQVLSFNKDFIKDFYEFRDKARKLNFKNFWGVKTSSTLIDTGITRYYILQGFNKIVNKKKNEYRVFFHNGKVKYIAQGDNIPSTCIKDDLMKPLQKEIILFAKKLFKDYVPLFWNLPRFPILFRIDVSYAVDPEFQDKYSINIEGFNTPVRIYANELEIDPTSFFYNSFICKLDKNFSSKIIQKNIAKYITKYIRELN
jgi:hypothetical protein